MKFISECGECQKLWKEYSAATTEHIRLEGKLRIATVEHDDAGTIDLTSRVEEAAKARHGARQAIEAHERSGHPESSEAGST